MWESAAIEPNTRWAYEHYETDCGADDRRHGVVNHSHVSRYSCSVLYLEASDDELRLSDRHHRRQTLVALKWCLLSPLSGMKDGKRIKGRARESWIE